MSPLRTFLSCAALALACAGAASAHAREGPAGDLAPMRSIDVASACPNAREVAASIVYPIAAVRAGVSNADIAVGFSVAASGEPIDIVVSSSSQPYFDDAVVAAVKRLRCPGVPVDARLKWHVALRVAP